MFFFTCAQNQWLAFNLFAIATTLLNYHRGPDLLVFAHTTHLKGNIQLIACKGEVPGLGVVDAFQAQAGEVEVIENIAVQEVLGDKSADSEPAVVVRKVVVHRDKIVVVVYGIGVLVYGIEVVVYGIEDMV